MKIRNRHQITDIQMEQQSILSGKELSQLIRRDMANQLAKGIAERIPIEVKRLDDMFQHGYELEQEMYILTRKQMKAIVDAVNSQGLAKSTLMDLFTIDIDVIEDVNLFPEDHRMPTKEEVEADVAHANTGRFMTMKLKK